MYLYMEDKEKYDSNGCTLSKPDDGKAIGQGKRGGLANLSNSVKNGKSYFNTEKITIIAQSGCGKTQLAFDLAYFIIGPYRHIIYLNSHFDDKIVVNFSKWCDKAGIGFWEIDVSNCEKDGLNIPKLSHCLYIIDDTYTSTGRAKPLDLLIKRLWNKGRWDGNHVIYIAHLDAYLPQEALKNATQIWVDRPYERFPVSSKIEGDNIGKKWYMMKNALDEKYGKISEAEFNTPIHLQQIVNRLKYKKNGLPKEKELADEKEYLEIGLQGNKKALESIEHSGKGKPNEVDIVFKYEDFF